MYDQRKKETLDIIRGLVTGEYVLTGTDRTLEGFGSGEMTAHFRVRTLLGSRTFPYSMFDPSIKKVIFHDPATIVFWEDGTKTVVKCGENDIFDPEKGLAMAIAKKALGNEGNYYNQIKKWLPEEEKPLSFGEMIRKAACGIVELGKAFRSDSDIMTIELREGRPIGYLTTAEAAKKFGVEQVTIRAWVDRNKLPALKIGKELWIPENSCTTKKQND